MRLALKPVSTTRRSSATPSPSVSFRYSRSGAIVTNTPPSHTITPLGYVRPVAKSDARVVAAIVIGVGQQRDDTTGRLGGLPLERIGIAAVLRDEEPAALVEGDRDGVLHERLRGDEIDAIAGLEDEAAQRVGRRQRATVVVATTRAPPVGAPACIRMDVASDTPAITSSAVRERSRSHRTTHRAAAPLTAASADRSASISSRASVMMRAASSSTRLVPSQVS